MSSAKPVPFIAIMVLAIGLLASAAGRPAHATVMIDPSPGNFPGDDNVVFNPCSGIDTGPALNVQGCLSQDHSILVNFRGTENLVVNGGQARILAADGSFNFLEIGLFDPNLLFTTFIVNINAVQGDSGVITFFADLEPDPDFGPSQEFILGNGQNFFKISISGGQLFDTLSFISSVGINSITFQDVRQIRIGGITSTTIPEPSNLALFAVGLVGLGFMMRKRFA